MPAGTAPPVRRVPGVETETRARGQTPRACGRTVSVEPRPGRVGRAQSSFNDPGKHCENDDNRIFFVSL